MRPYLRHARSVMLRAFIDGSSGNKVSFRELANPLERVVRDYGSPQMLCTQADLVRLRNKL